MKWNTHFNLWNALLLRFNRGPVRHIREAQSQTLAHALRRTRKKISQKVVHQRVSLSRDN